jgi:hypothetical protein
MIETPEAAYFGGTGQPIPGSTLVIRRRLPTGRFLASLCNFARSAWRQRTPGADFQHTPSVRDAVENGHAKLRVVAEMAVIVAVMAVGTMSAGAAEATEQHGGVERLTDSSRVSDPDVGAQVVGTSRNQPLRSRSSSSVSELEKVDLFGDSLGYQAEPYLDMFFAQTHDYAVTNYTYGGTATCDWLSTMAAAAAQRPQDALFVFSGNAFTPCMDGVALRSPQYYDLYTAYTEQAIGIFSAVGAHVFLVGTPVDESSVAGWDQLDDIYRQLSQANPLTVSYVDGGASVETATGGFTWALPCLSIEPSCGRDGTNVVRSPDGIHFCPDGPPATRGITTPCDEYSPGAFRFALALLDAVTQYTYSTPGDK